MALRIELESGYVISDDPALIDLELITRYLAEDSYWAKGRSAETVATAVNNSTVLGVFAVDGMAQVGQARLVSDKATFAWLCDVFVLEAHSGRGLGKALVGAAVEYCDSLGIRQVVLATADAHGLYAQNGFKGLDQPSRWMDRSHGGTAGDAQ